MTNDTETKEEYIPGTCNIGKEEIKKRRNSAIFSAVLSVILIVLLEFSSVNKFWCLVLFFPLTSAGIGFQQWYFKFCLNFAMKGIFNFNKPGESIAVQDDEMRKLDRDKAMGMIRTGIAFGLVLTVLLYSLL